MNHIKKVSRVFRILFIVGFIGLPLLSIWYWFAGGAHVAGSLGESMIPRGIVANVAGLPVYVRAAGFMVNLIPLAKDLFILFFLIKLFGFYAQAKIFVDESVTLIRNIGIVLLIYQLIRPIYDLLISYVLTAWRPHHGEMIISFGSPQAMEIIGAVIIILIAWIMREACRLQEEQQLTV